jgi:bifunctional non-homologous end joining protein LigD
MIRAPEATLRIKKEQREKKILIDIYRNRPGQTLVCAYSLRARETSRGPCISFPISWESLEDLPSCDYYSMADALVAVESGEDPWQGMELHASALHTRKKPAGPARKKAGKASGSKQDPDSRPEAAQGQDPVKEQLTQYRKKRSFDRTPEPAGGPASGQTSIFVLHRHHASRLHYDLRIEENGTLRSWALPRGLPPRPGIKRLAVHVEDHPLEYADFEGVIPKGQYGAGQMWIFARGKCEMLKRKEDGGFYFRLHSEEISADFRIFPTRGSNDWLIERLDEPPDHWHPSAMLAEAASELPQGSYEYEVKWDGIRALISLDEGQTTIRSRNGLDLTEAFPELKDAASALNAASAIVDGEIVCLDSQGRPVFSDVIRRMQNPGSLKLQKKSPAVCCLFDVLYLDGRSILRDPWHLRRAWLKDIIRKDTAYRFSESFSGGQDLLNAAREHGLEGIMAKETASPYTPGRRSRSWLKIKLRSTEDCWILGWSESKTPDRSKTFASLQLAVRGPDGLRYTGKVGTGMDDAQMLEMKKTLLALKKRLKPAAAVPALEARDSHWVEPTLACEVQYASLTKDGLLREPVFLRLRPDLEQV